MARTGWNFVLIQSRTQAKVRQVFLPFPVIIAFLVFAAAGSLGLIRLATFATTYAVAKFGVFEARRDNAGLLSKVNFLCRFVQKEASRIEELIAFEDAARLKYGLKSISDDVRKAGVGGNPSKEEMMVMTLMDPVVLRAEAVKESLGVLLRQARLQDSTFSEIVNYVEKLHERWSHRPSTWPSQGKVTSGYGYRYHPFEGTSLFHEGMDIANKIWTPVFATADGVVETSGYKDYYGNLIVLHHPGSGYETAYAHLQKTAVTRGQKVKRGEMIGFVGNTGRSTGPHLHYEVRENGRPLNPSNFILPHDIIVD